MRDTQIAVRVRNHIPESILVLTLDLDQRDGVWTGTCIELGTSTYADTLEGLRKELGDAILLQLNEIDRLGFMEEYLREHGATETPLLAHPVDSKQPVERWGPAGAGV